MLTWALYILATRHDIQDTLCAEITILAAEHPDPTFLQIDSLVYLENFIKETMRVYAPATVTYLRAEAYMTIDGVFIPKDTVIDMIIDMIPSGEDADDVDPTRWDRLEGDQSSPYAYNVFSNGPRVCIGKTLALVEIKIILFEIVQTYRCVKVARDFTVENPSLSLRPVGMEVHLAKIGSIRLLGARVWTPKEL
ncbi:Uu.00g084330.m01.CDS01 [Anthostomella pinea]|uniref:Uu.00g084330.m01.CDS01 n=1 Tax=Anthostomella pinea TaxID=933095 RepID=A0AAI8YJQ5_9PEZI|nr:Uu.00g084330.m01.CDS01 [Anthostomella pinea]